MTLSRRIPLPESGLADRAPGVVGRSRTGRSRPIHGARAPKSKLSTKAGQVHSTMPARHTDIVRRATQTKIMPSRAAIPPTTESP